MASPATRSSATPNGSFEISVGPRARPGNWLPTGGIERYVLVLRLYDTPIGVATARPRRADPDDHAEGMPVIRLALWLLGGVLLGGIVHLATVLVLPSLATPGRLFAPGAADDRQCRQRRPAADAGEGGAAVHGSGLCDGGVPLRSHRTAR